MRRHMFLGAMVGLAFAFGTFDLRYLAGTGPRWQHPSPDLVAYLAGTYYYLDDAWRLPLFDVPSMGYPEGGSVVYNDAIPIGALASKIVATLTGLKFAHLGPWTVLCYALEGAFIARLAHLAGNRCLLGATALIALAMSSLIVLIRPEHIALTSHFLLIWALCVYAEASAGRLRSWPVTILAAVAVLVNIYLFAMVAAILAAAATTAWFRGADRDRLRRTILQSTLVIGVIVFAAGFVTTREGVRLASWGFGYFSWNPATLVVPPPGLWLWGGAGMGRDAPQEAPYEGESYLGLGALALLTAAIWIRRRDLGMLLRSHAALVVVVVICAGFAASNRLTIGPWHIIDLPMLPWMRQATGIFRASGRFIWPLVFLLSLIPALLLSRRLPRRLWLVIVGLAAVVQTIEAWPVRRMATAYSRTAEPDVIGQNQFDSWLDGHDRIWQYPSWFCGGFGRDPAVRHLAVRQETQIQFLAARKGLPMNSVYMARRAKDCEREAGDARALRMDDRTLYVFSSGAVAETAGLRELAATRACRTATWGVVCSTRWLQPPNGVTSRTGRRDLPARMDDPSGR
jgi:hypothetical protein